jgi:group I intron endonuclease
MANSTTHCIYRIVCFQTFKTYIGQSKDKNRRQDEHFRSLRTNTHVNQRLQNAFNKYGEGSFYFEVIETNIPPNKVNEREVYWIAHYDSYRNGYNMTRGGEESGGNFRPIKLGDVEYASLQEAADSLGLTKRELQTALKRRNK